MNVQLLRAADRTPQPWRNGGGVTTEMACEPAGADFESFGWRVSTAEVAAAGPFSRFASVDRRLSVLDGRLSLSFDDAAAVMLTPHDDAFAFAGDVSCHGTPLDGPVRDLNVMVRRGQWRARVARVASSGAFDVDETATTVLMVSTHPSATITVGSARHVLGPLDALRLDGTDCRAPLTVSATAQHAAAGALHVITLMRVAQR